MKAKAESGGAGFPKDRSGTKRRERKKGNIAMFAFFTILFGVHTLRAMNSCRKVLNMVLSR